MSLFGEKQDKAGFSVNQRLVAAPCSRHVVDTKFHAAEQLFVVSVPSRHLTYPLLLICRGHLLYSVYGKMQQRMKVEEKNYLILQLGHMSTRKTRVYYTEFSILPADRFHHVMNVVHQE